MGKKLKWIQTGTNTYIIQFMGADIAQVFKGEKICFHFLASPELHRFDSLEEAKAFGEDLIIREMAYYLTEFFNELNKM